MFKNRFLVKFHGIALVIMLFVSAPAFLNVTASASEQSSFYGIWCSASKSEAEAYDYANWLSGYGFAARVFMTTDWSNLNSEPWYVISAGMYYSESDAYAALPSVQQVVTDAYVKYSGSYQGVSEVSDPAPGDNTITANESPAKYGKDISKTVDSFVFGLLSEAHMMCSQDADFSASNFLNNIHKLYTGEFSEKQKSMIAASNTDMDYAQNYYEVTIYETSADRVKETYFDLFGTKAADLILPEVRDVSDNSSSYYLNYAITPDGMVRNISYDMENEIDTELLEYYPDDKGQMVFRKKYQYYSYWGNKAAGQNPTVSLIVKVYAIPNDDSPYGYNLVGLEF